jgi:hypothetical protein
MKARTAGEEVQYKQIERALKRIRLGHTQASYYGGVLACQGNHRGFPGDTVLSYMTG